MKISVSARTVKPPTVPNSTERLGERTLRLETGKAGGMPCMTTPRASDLAGASGMLTISLPVQEGCCEGCEGLLWFQAGAGV